MTITIDDISSTEQLDRAALTAVRGGILHGVAVPSPTVPSPWTGPIPQMPSFPDCFPFNGSSPFPLAAQPTTQPVDVIPI